MSSKLFLLASTSILISTLVSIDHTNFFFFSHPFFIKSYLNDDSQHLQVIPVEGAEGPESFGFDPNGGGPYTGVSDGRIIRWDENEGRWVNFATTSPKREGCEGQHDHYLKEHICGRPLGLCFNGRTGDLYIADAYMGLLVVGPKGGTATNVQTQGEAFPLGFANGLDIDQSSGLVYFSDSSSRYQRRNYLSVILSGDKTGRLMKYDPRSKEVTTLVYNLSFPNGVALSQNGHFILVAETTTCRILKLWLETPKAGMVEDFAQLPGFPDNIKRNSKGEFWVGIHSRKGSFLKWVLSYPWIGNALAKLPLDVTRIYSYLSRFRGCGLAVKLGQDGDVLEMLEDERGERWRFVSEVMEQNGCLWIGSVKMPFVVKQKINIST